jgi:hypothetical protein
MRAMRAFALSFAVLLSACPGPTPRQTTTPPPSNDGNGDGGGTQSGPAPVIATLQREPCFGFCPVYKIAIHADGLVEYDGERFVKIRGHQEGQLDADALAKLHAAFAKADYFSLNDSYEDMQVTDLPYVNTSYTQNDRTKSVRHYYGDKSAPDVLRWLEEEIDRIVQIKQWIGTDEEREQHAGEWR